MAQTIEKAVIPTRYDRLMISLHWIMALLIVGNYVGGLTVDFFPKSLESAVVNLHALIGVTLLALVALRLVWRFSHPTPPFPASMSPLFQRAADLGHGLLYLLMIAVPVLGLPSFFLRGKALDFGFFQVGPLFDANRDLAHQITEVHEWAAHLLIAVAVGHILVALYHQLVLRDNLLARQGIDRG